MEIVDAKWGSDINRYTILCECGKEIIHRVDRWMVRCKYCKRVENLKKIRSKFPSEIWKSKYPHRP